MMHTPDNTDVSFARESAALAEQGLSVLDIVQAVAVSNFAQLTQQEIFELEQERDMELPAVQFALGITPEQEAQTQAEQAADYEKWEAEYWELVRMDAKRLEALCWAWINAGDSSAGLVEIGQEAGAIVGRYPGLLDRMDPLGENVEALRAYAFGMDLDNIEAAE